MKQVLLVTLFFAALSFSSQAQSNSNTATPALISFKIKNNSLLPAKVTVISYRPDETGNGTSGYLIGSFGSRTLNFPVGTKIFLANSNQVNTVMSGATIKNQPPFLTVKKEDAGLTFPIK